MSKVIKAAAIAAAIVFTAGAITVGFAAGSMTALTFGTGLGLTATGMAVFTFVTTLVGGLIGGMGSTGGSAGNGNFGTKFAARASIEPRQLIYGRCRVGGTYVHMSTSGTDNNLFHGVIVLAGHEIQSLQKVKINETELTTSTTTINGETVYKVTNSKYRNTDNDNKLDTSGTLIRYTFENGSQTTANGFLSAQVSAMGANDIGKGCAYVYIQMVFDAEAFGGGIPQLSFEIEGKKVFDPRDSTTAFSDNPALCLRDYISNTEYGLKALDDEINDATTAGGFAAAANVCDQTVTLANGVSTETRYTCNGFTNFSADGRSVLEVLLSSCAGRLTYSNGKFNMFAGASQTPSLTITDDDLLDSVRVVTNPASGELFNAVKPIHINKDLNYNSADGVVYEDSTFLAADTPSNESSANYKKMLEVQLPFTVTGTMAQRLAKIALNSQRQTTTISVFTSLKFMRLQPTDWVYVTNDRLSYSQKTFEVISTNMETKTEGDTMILGTRLELKEIDASVFNYATSDYQDPQDEGSDVGSGDFSVSAPSSLSLTQQSNVEGATFKADIIASWTNAASDKIIGTEIAYKLSTDTNYTGDIFVGKGITSGIIPNVVVGKTYNVKVKHLDMNGVASDYTSAVNITISDGTSISAPTNFSANSNRIGILLSWTNPSNTNLRAIKVYRKTVNSTPTDDTNLVHTMNGEPSAVTRFYQGQMDGLTDGVTYYFWLRAITHNGTHSAFTTSVNGSFSKYNNVDIGLSNVEDKSSADIRDEIDVDDLVGSGKTFSVKPNKTTFADGSTEGVFNFQLDDGTATGVNVFSSAERTKLDRLRSGQDPSDASKSILNDNISISKVSGAVRLSGGSGSSSDVSFDNSDVGLGNVLNATQVKTDLTNAPDAIKNNQISISKSGSGALSLNNAGSGSVTLDNTDVGLDNVLNATQVKVDLTNAPNAIKNAEITSTDVVGPSGKLFTSLPESGATVGATAGTNLKDSSDNTLSDEDVRNDDLSLAFSGTNLQIKKGTTQIGSNVDAPNALKNAEITSSDVVGPSGKLFTALPASGATVGATVGTNLTDSGGNSLNDEDVRNDDLDIDTSGTSLRIKKGTTIIQSTTLAKSNVGLSNLNSLDSSASTKLGGIAAGATVGAVAGTNLKDSSNNTLGDEDVRNDDLSLAFSGTNIQIKKGTTQIGSNVDAPNALKNAEITSSDVVGPSGKLFTSLPASGATVGATVGTNLTDSEGNALGDEDVRNDDLSLAFSGTDLQIKKGSTQIGSNLSAPAALKNDQISITASNGTVTLNNASSTNNTFTKSSVGLGNVIDAAQVKLDLSNAPNAIKNTQISLTASNGTVTLNNASSTNNTFNKTSVGLGNVLDAAQVKLDLSNAPNDIKNTQISLSASGGTVTLNNASSTNNSFSKSSIGLSNVTNDAQVKLDLTNAPDSIKNSEITSSDLVGPSGKVFTTLPESGATVGAELDNNLVDENGNDLNSSDLVTSLGTSNDTANVSGRASATVKSEAQVGNNTGTNFVALVDDLNDPTSALNITGERLTGGVIEGSLIKTDELKLKTNGTSASGTTITVNSTMSSDFIADIGTGSGMYMGGISVGGLTGSSIRGASIHLDIRAGSSSTNLYSKYFPIGIKESNQYYDTGDGYELGENTMEMEFMYFYTGTETLKAYITADSNGTSSGLLVKCRAVKFGSEQPNAFTFTDELSLAAASNNTTYETSNTITLGGFSGNLTASISGHSSAQMSINSGTFTTSDTSVDSGDTIQLRILKPSTDATTRSATLNVGGVQDTYTIRTTGTYTPDPDDGYGCFAAGSLIWLGDGNYKPIEEVKVGDIVMTYNQEINGFEPKECTYTMTPKDDEIYKFTFWENDKELHTTDAHPLLGADHKWYSMDPVKCLKEHHIAAEPLTQYTELLFMDRELTSVSIKNIEMVGVQEVYNLSEVADNHNFIVDGIIAHNVRSEIKP